MPHKIEVFSAECPLCNRAFDEIEGGRCAGCQLIIYNFLRELGTGKKLWRKGSAYSNHIL